MRLFMLFKKRPEAANNRGKNKMAPVYDSFMCVFLSVKSHLSGFTIKITPYFRGHTVHLFKPN